MFEKNDAAADDAVDAGAATAVVAALDVDAVVVAVVTFAVLYMTATIVALTACDCDCDVISAKVIEKVRLSRHNSRARTTVCFVFCFTRFGRGSCMFGGCSLKTSASHKGNAQVSRGPDTT